MAHNWKTSFIALSTALGTIAVCGGSYFAYERFTPAAPAPVADAPGTMHYVVMWWIQQEAEQQSEPNQYTGEQSKPVKKKVVCIRSKGFKAKGDADAFIAAAPADVKSHMQPPVEIPGGF